MAQERIIFLVCVWCTQLKYKKSKSFEMSFDVSFSSMAISCNTFISSMTQIQLDDQYIINRDSLTAFEPYIILLDRIIVYLIYFVKSRHKGYIIITNFPHLSFLLHITNTNFSHTDDICFPLMLLPLKKLLFV